jgi:hypothetical protein
MTATLILSSLGGIIAFVGIVVVTIRGIFRIVNATEDNTDATRDLTAKLDKAFDLLNNHEGRLGILEDRSRRNGHP